MTATHHAGTSPATDYEVVIGLEVHAQVVTESKMFCGCSSRYSGAPPNTLVCPVCLGMPGSLPVMNRTAVEATIITALALNCEIPEFSKFDRKNYNYPDLMKGYQISQFDLPFSQAGWLEFDDPANPGQMRRAGITRVHLEEDTATLKHVRDSSGETYSLMDVNRAGVPLMEIVGDPDLRTADEAGSYLRALRQILRYLGVSTANMDEGAFRCDANVSLRPWGQAEYGAKVEVKNMNSFRSVVRAIEFEIVRQRDILDAGGRIVQETRGWVDDRAITVTQRSKEAAHDYRYFPEPDLPPIVTPATEAARLRSLLPELPDAKRHRFADAYGMTADIADTLTQTRALAEYFEQTAHLSGNARATANWITRDVLRILGNTGAEIDQILLTPAHLADLIKLLDTGTISVRTAPEVLEEAVSTGSMPHEIVQKRGLGQVSDTNALTTAVADAIASNPKAVADYRAGKATAMGFLVGAVMKATRGKGNPGLVNELLKQQLDG
ncbi:MAG: aspartyl/glutamyl-tRNA(Asn/Gln) amidotransferase subunit [Chloroflexota bacterium]|jgi:aspartyl-tRNA(Asn)/glutamyl-tRNA(Gln) amidotransferase subunit B|nr:MAG: Asp-tRNA(Asn)/Glu-tRNA(Gln) amidotransferase subunit GatB [Chloroflexota bacterium]